MQAAAIQKNSPSVDSPSLMKFRLTMYNEGPMLRLRQWLSCLRPLRFPNRTTEQRFKGRFQQHSKKLRDFEDMEACSSPPGDLSALAVLGF
jgi:hypothetical protein